MTRNFSAALLPVIHVTVVTRACRGRFKGRRVASESRHWGLVTGLHGSSLAARASTSAPLPQRGPAGREGSHPSRLPLRQQWPFADPASLPLIGRLMGALQPWKGEERAKREEGGREPEGMRQAGSQPASQPG